MHWSLPSRDGDETRRDSRARARDARDALERRLSSYPRRAGDALKTLQHARFERLRLRLLPVRSLRQRRREERSSARWTTALLLPLGRVTKLAVGVFRAIPPVGHRLGAPVRQRRSIVRARRPFLFRAGVPAVRVPTPSRDLCALPIDRVDGDAGTPRTWTAPRLNPEEARSKRRDERRRGRRFDLGDVLGVRLARKVVAAAPQCLMAALSYARARLPSRA